VNQERYFAVSPKEGVSRGVAIVTWVALRGVLIVHSGAEINQVSWIIDSKKVDGMAPRDNWSVLVGPEVSSATPLRTVAEGTLVSYSGDSVVARMAVDAANVLPPVHLGTGRCE
jgi:hypothetical protein